MTKELQTAEPILSVEIQPYEIKANFEKLEKIVEEKVSRYQDIEYDITNEAEIKNAKASRKYLNSIANEIDTRRKSVKNEYLKPLNEFEARANQIRDIAKDASDKINKQIHAAEDRARKLRFDDLKKHYEEYAPTFASLVPYEKIHVEQWANKTTSTTVAKEEIELLVDRINTEWDTLKSQNLFYPEATEQKFLETLDLGEALSYDAKLNAENKRIQSIKKEPPREAPTPAPVPNDTPPLAPAPAAAKTPEHESPWVIVVHKATQTQAKEIGKILGSNGVTGTFLEVTDIQRALNRAHKELMHYVR